MIISKVSEVCLAQMPAWAGDSLYMHPIRLEKEINLPEHLSRWTNYIKSLLFHSPIKAGKAYITIDEKEIKKGNSHRRGRSHIDGNYLFGWEGGGGGWLTGTPGRILTPTKHSAQYGSNKGGLLIVSSYAACQAWEGTFNEIPGQGGDCEHFRGQFGESTILKSHHLYWMNSTGIHQSMPIMENVKRSLVRITLPHTAESFIN